MSKKGTIMNHEWERVSVSHDGIPRNKCTRCGLTTAAPLAAVRSRCKGTNWTKMKDMRDAVIGHVLQAVSDKQLGEPLQTIHKNEHEWVMLRYTFNEGEAQESLQYRYFCTRCHKWNETPPDGVDEPCLGYNVGDFRPPTEEELKQSTRVESEGHDPGISRAAADVLMRPSGNYGSHSLQDVLDDSRYYRKVGLLLVTQREWESRTTDDYWKREARNAEEVQRKAVSKYLEAAARIEDLEKRIRLLIEQQAAELERIKRGVKNYGNAYALLDDKKPTRWRP